MQLEMKHYLNYVSAGPLSFLLMDSENGQKLGLYKDIQSGELVLIGLNGWSDVVFYPNHEMLLSAMENQIELDQLLLHHSRVTDLNKKVPGILKMQAIKCWVKREFTGTLVEQSRSQLYPNHYYIFREYLNRFERAAV
ncbi:MAG: hypothetical protein ACO29O_09650 [Chitinophagaceae bacterium]